MRDFFARRRVEMESGASLLARFLQVFTFTGVLITLIGMEEKSSITKVGFMGTLGLLLVFFMWVVGRVYYKLGLFEEEAKARTERNPILKGIHDKVMRE